METTMTTETKNLREEYAVRVEFWDAARAKLEKIARKAARLGCPAPTWRVLCEQEREHDTGKRNPVTREKIVLKYTVKIVELTGEAPTVAGWLFAATIQHEAAGNILRRTPGLDEAVVIPAQYRDCSQACDHCHQDRRRNDTFLVREEATGAWKQVGRSCLCDFLGGHDPHRALSGLECFFEAMGALEGGDDDHWLTGDDRGGRGEWLFPVDTLLTYVSMFIRTEGWLGRVAARAQDRTATADQALWLMTPAFTFKAKREQDELRARVVDGDATTAAEAIAWVKSELEAKDVGRRNEYEHNLVVAMSRKETTRRNAGIVASAVFAFLRAKEREVQRRASLAGKKSEWFGVLEEEKIITRGANIGRIKKTKPRYTLELTVERVHSTEGDWGVSHIVKLVDAEGRCFTWFTGSTQGIYAGDKIRGTFSVKKHVEYKGWKETQITRPSGLEVVKPGS